MPRSKTKKTPDPPPETYRAPVRFYATLTHRGREFQYLFQPNHTYRIVEDDQAEHAVSSVRKELSKSAYDELIKQTP